MALRFQETMAGGARVGEQGRRFAFTVLAESPTLLAVSGFAPLRLSGTATLEGVADAADLGTGSLLEIGLPFHRFLRYQVHFQDDTGHRWRFFGEKTVRLLHLARTMTTLRGRVFRDGVEAGPAELRFRWRDLGRFLASWRPWPARAPVARLHGAGGSS